MYVSCRWVHEKWREALTARFDVTQARAEGSLAVAPCLIVAVYGLDLVVAGPAIYVIRAMGVTRVDKVVAGGGDDLVVAFAGPDLVVPAATPDVVVAGMTAEAVGLVGPHELIVAAGAG